MGSWSTFRWVRLFIFALIVFVSLLLTITFALLLSKDFRRYNAFQRVLTICLVVVDGITAILMYLMLAVRYSMQLDAARIVVLFAVQTTGTTLFTLNDLSFPCTAFGAVRMCRQISFYTTIVSWVLCGLLVTYGACLVIMACVPHPPPIGGSELGLDDEVPISPEAQRVTHHSMDSHMLLVNPDPTRPHYSVRPLPVVPATRFVEKPRLQVQQSGLGYTPKRHPSTSGTESVRSANSPTSILEVDYGTSNFVLGRRLLPPVGAYADPVSRVLTQTPASVSSNRTIPVPIGFAKGPGATYLPSPPPMAQFNPAPRPQMRRIPSSSSTSSIYSVKSGEVRRGMPRPMPSMGVRRAAPAKQPARSATSDSTHWK